MFIIGTKQNDDALNTKTNPKNNSTKDDKSSAGDNSTDDVFEKEIGISNDKPESNPLVSKINEMFAFNDFISLDGRTWNEQ